MIRETPNEPSREELIALIAALRADNAALKARIAELERRLGLNSSHVAGLASPCVCKRASDLRGPFRGPFLFRGIILSNLLPVPLVPLRIADVNDRNRPALKVVINLVRTAWHVQFVHVGLISWWRKSRL
jgi:hypothetical protein